MVENYDHCKEFLTRHGLGEPRCGAYFGPGWTKILDALVTDLKAMAWDGDCHQIKEKFGGLRFYIGCGNDEIWERIDKAEMESRRTCEECGEPGAPRSGGWIKTLCDAHGGGRKSFTWTNPFSGKAEDL
jgi:hypothetical protein